jgi:undecaprenyl-diphosphatase
MDDNRVQTSPSGFQLIPETATFLDLCIAACCGWIFLRLAARVKGGATKELDETILRVLRHRDNLAIPRGPKWLPQVSQDITSLGSGTNLTLASGIAVGFLCLQRRFRAAGFLIVSLGSGLMLSYLLKNFFLRERPTVVPRLTHFDPGSFPSGHSMGAALVYLTLGGIISRQTRRLLSKAYFLSVALVLTVLVGVSRIYLGVHFPSDVLAGWAVGSLWSTLCTQTARWLQREGTVEPPKSD